MMGKRFVAPLVAVALVATLAGTLASPATAAKNPGGGGGGGTPTTYTATWAGSGTSGSGASRVLNVSKCDASNTPYVTFLLSGTKATSATFWVGAVQKGTMSLRSTSKRGNVLHFTYQPGAFIDLEALLKSPVTAKHTNSTVGTLSIESGCVGVQVNPNCPNTIPPDTFFEREVEIVDGGTSTFQSYPRIEVYDSAQGASSPVPPIANRTFTVKARVYQLEKVSSVPFSGSTYLGEVRDAKGTVLSGTYAIVTPLPGECVTISAGQGPGALKGTLTVTTDATGTATWNDLVYSAATENLTLNLETGSNKGASAFRAVTPLTTSLSTVVLAGAVEASSTIVGVPNTRTSTSITFGTGEFPATATATLANGAYGTVHLWATSMPCLFEYQLALGASCAVVYLDLETKQWDAFGNVVPGSELYDPNTPARLLVTCDPADCPPYIGAVYSLGWEYGTYPIRVDLRQDMGGYLDYVSPVLSAANAPRCVPAVDTTTTGQILDAAALAVGYCVDVNAITRSAANVLTRPILFVEDPRAGSTSK